MRILVIHNFYREFGGTDAVVASEVELLRRAGHEVVEFFRHSSEIADYGFCDKVRFLKRTIYCQESARNLQSIVQEQNPDVAYIHNVFPLISPSAYDMLHSLGIPMVQMLHDFRFLCPNAWFFRHGNICELCSGGQYSHAVKYRCYRRSRIFSMLYATAISMARHKGLFDMIDSFICPSAFLLGKFRTAGVAPEKLTVRPHGIDTQELHPGKGPGSYALFIGRLSAEKGVWSLVHAFESTPQIPLKIAGTGPEERRMKQYIADRNLTHIEMAGFVEGVDKQALLESCRFVVAPSICQESFGLMILDAFAAGRPVLASDLGSFIDMVEDGVTGSHFHAGDADDLSKQAAIMYEDTENAERMGRAARELALSRYSSERCIAQLMEILETAARTKPDTV